MYEKPRDFTEDDLDSCWPYYKDYLISILNGLYHVDLAREDLRGLIGSKYDPRVNPASRLGTGSTTEAPAK